jgi:peptidoglycan/xylan/chitin deacetylase (PgdA/CDA1 family)
MYHRVAAVAVDPWGLCVTPEHFAQHLDVLKTRYGVMPLRELARGAGDGRMPDKAVAISFDDGYADNVVTAMPLLEAAGLPATVFVATAAVDGTGEFWWDELQRLVLEADALPTTVSVSIRGTELSWTVRSPDEAAVARPLMAWEGAPGSPLALYHGLWEAILPLTTGEQQQVLEQLRAVFGGDRAVGRAHRTVTAEELRMATRSRCMEIGAHTVNHPTLPAHPEYRQRAEIVGGKRRLEEIVDSEVRCFAYPFGDHDRVSKRLVREAGFELACTTVEDTVGRRTDPFLLPRFAVGDWDGEEFARRLQRLHG